MYWLTMEEKITKDIQLRNNEYYCMQETFDYLYLKSQNCCCFYSLIKYIIDERNLRLAYRNIKTNKGSKTSGLSGKNITFIGNMKLCVYLKFITKRILYYVPSLVKRVGIPKHNGKIRYLGIKEPWDKIIEQAIYQILEPILTAKFHNNSNGFIKGRSQKRAIAQFTNFIIKDKLYYVIDLDIKGFFDEVNHGKLLKQLWTCGVRDKNLLSLISKMLKAEIFNVGIPDKGTPQGGILSPLLANLVLNELDWWLESKSSKGIRFVRFADDVKILCPTYPVARNMLDKTTKWLNNRLSLQVSDEKTKIINLKRNYSIFLGFKFKIKIKKGKVKIVSHMSDKSIDSVKFKVKCQSKKIKKTISNKKRNIKEIDKYNSLIVGIHNYYCTATNIYEDLHSFDWDMGAYFNKFLSKIVLDVGNNEYNNNFIINKYGKNLKFIRGKPLIPIGNISYEEPRYRGTKINYYQESSRRLFHKNLELDNLFIVSKLLYSPIYDETLEFNDNVISRFCGQYGKYEITKKLIFDLNNVCAIRIKDNGSDKYNNIILVENKVKKLIKLKEVDDIIELSILKKGLTLEQLEKINIIRKENSLSLI